MHGLHHLLRSVKTIDRSKKKSTLEVLLGSSVKSSSRKETTKTLPIFKLKRSPNKSKLKSSHPREVRSRTLSSSSKNSR